MHENSIKITRITQSSCFKVITPDRVLYFDPGYTGLYNNQGILPAMIKEKADIVLISHAHQDHLQPELLHRLIAPETQILAPLSCQALISTKITCVKAGDSVNVGNVKITVTEAYNTPEGHSYKKFHHPGEGVGYLVHLNETTIYFAGDTDLIPEMRHFGTIDVAMLPIGGTYVMDNEEALQAVSILQPRIVIAMHQAANSLTVFRDEVKAKTEATAIVLNVGESYTIQKS